MAEFKAITTQAELDAAIQERIERERKKYADYDELKEKATELEALRGKDYEGIIAGLRSELAEANGKLTGLAALTERAGAAERRLMQQKVAHECGIPYELAGRLTGDDEAALRKDAEGLSKFFTGAEIAPLAAPEPVLTGNGGDAALRSVLSQLDGGSTS